MPEKLRKFNLDKEALLIIIGFGLVFGLGSLFLYELSARLFSLGFFFGAFLGFAALPFIDSKKWKPKPWTCASMGMLGGFAFAYLSGLPPFNIGSLSIGGFIFGYFAPFWAKYM